MSNWDIIINNFSISTNIIVFIFGIIGNILNIIVFKSLKTFRKNSCAFCLLTLSISDIGMLLFNTMPNFLTDIFNDYHGINAIFSCKISISFAQTFALISHTIVCLAAIDQYLSTLMDEHRKGISFFLIQRLIIIFIFIYILHGIPFLVYYQAETLPGTNMTTCRLDSDSGAFSKYLIYVCFPIMGGLLPLSIMSIFGLIALRNVRTMTRRRVHIIRLRLEQQLTAMVLVKILFVCITVIPFLINYIVRFTILSSNNDAIVQKKLLLIMRVISFLLGINYADSFYIFLATSLRFRRQIKFVLYDIYFKKLQAKRNTNQVQPVAESFVLSIASSYQHRS